DRGLALDVIEGRGVRQVAREDGEEDDGEDQAPDGQHRAPVEEVAEEGATRLLAAALLIAVRSAVFTRHESPFCSGVTLERNRSGRDSVQTQIFAPARCRVTPSQKMPSFLITGA